MKRTVHNYTFVATDQRLRIRMPLVGYFAIPAMFGIFMLVLWIMVETGLVDAVVYKVQPPMFAVFLLLLLIAWGRWWTFDRKADSVRFFPWRLCSLSAIRGVRVAQRLRRRKYTNYIAHAIELELEAGNRVRLGGEFSSLLDATVARDMATEIGAWLRVPVALEIVSGP